MTKHGTPNSINCSRIIADERSGNGTNALDDLPEWNLNDLYSTEDTTQLEADFSWLESEGRKLNEAHRMQVAELGAEGLHELIIAHERMETKMSRIWAFAELRRAEDTNDPLRGKFANDCNERLAEINRNMVFLKLEIAQIDDCRFDRIMSDPCGPSPYRPMLDSIRKMRPHQLSNAMEQYVIDRKVSGKSAWIRLFEETISGMQFSFDRSQHTLSEALDKLASHNRPTRRKAAFALAKTFRRNQPLLTLITNTLAKDKATDDKWRGFSTPQAARHLDNEVEAEVVETLKNTVIQSYERIAHRYYGLKADWLGLRKLEIWDRNAPLPLEPETKIGWQQARATILEAFSGFAPEFAEIASQFFQNNWIDAPMRPGKEPGAFSSSTSTEVHPYVLVNFAGRPRDVMTLAHELGHGVHQVLASSQGEFLSKTPLVLAETASVFGEMLTFRKLLSLTPNGPERRALLANKVEDTINTVIRQIAFHEFESRLHERRIEGELTSDDINGIWMEVQVKSLGPAFRFTKGYETYWSYVPHFIHTPFYVYSYAFGHGLAQALFAVYEDGQNGFEQRYLEMLRAGGSRNYRELLSWFDLDPTKPDFWQGGLNFAEDLIDELEETTA